MIPGPVAAQRAIILSWTECLIFVRFSGDISGVKSSNDASLVLKTSDGKETTRMISFQAILDHFTFWENGECQGWYWGCSKDWTLFDYRLVNDYVISDRILWEDYGGGHSEITSCSPLNTPNVSAKTVVHSGVAAFGVSKWTLYLQITGPKGLPYK